ncbi:MAG TPA: site-2 protease family protein [Acidimicrobiia bacterium]|nr:site-2 protease family protein [Acidimicrobiia bacterium]
MHEGLLLHPGRRDRHPGRRPRSGGIRILGIPVGFHWTLLLVIGLVAAELSAGLFPGAGAVAVLGGVVLAAALFASVLAHELGHSVVARHEGVEVDGITLWLLGGTARLRNTPDSPGGAFRIAIAGPLVSLGLAVGFGLAAGALSAFVVPAAVVDSLAWLALVNGVLAVFNLVPAAPLDGGRILAAALWAHHGDQWRASATAARAGRLVGWGLVALGAAGLVLGSDAGGLWPMLLGGFVLWAAGGELRHATARRDLRDVLVRDVMQLDPEVAPGWLTIEGFVGEHAGRFAAAPGHILPVARWEGEVAGVVSAAQLGGVPPEQRRSTRVLDVAVPIERLRVARPEEPLGDVLDRPGLDQLVLVFEGSRLVGLVRPVDVVRAVAGFATRVRAPRPGSAPL